MTPTRPTARTGRLLSRISLGDRRRLTPTSPTGLAHQLLQLSDVDVPLSQNGVLRLDLSFKIGNPIQQPGHHGFQLSDPVPYHPPRSTPPHTTNARYRALRATYPLSKDSRKSGCSK